MGGGNKRQEWAVEIGSQDGRLRWAVELGVRKGGKEGGREGCVAE